MTGETFSSLWDQYTNLWLQTRIDDTHIASDLCTFERNAKEKVYHSYLILKDYVKEKYFLAMIKGKLS